MLSAQRVCRGWPWRPLVTGRAVRGRLCRGASFLVTRCADPFYSSIANRINYKAAKANTVVLKLRELFELSVFCWKTGVLRHGFLSYA